MWVQYKHSKDSRLKKFQFSVGDNIPVTLPAEGTSIWILADSTRAKLFESESVPDVINTEISNLENMKLIGIAELRKDSITGLKLWATFNNEGGEHINLSPSQPLIIPAEGKLQLGTKIGFYVPKD